MSNSAKARLQALENQLTGGTSLFNDDSQADRISEVSNDTRLEGKVIIVTGVNSKAGIGCASAFHFARGKARAIYLCDFDDSNLEAIKRDLKLRFPNVDLHTRKFDAADEERVKEVVAHALATYKRLDVFFANAGKAGAQTIITEVEKSEFMKVMETNSASVFLAIKHAAPAMTETSDEKPASAGSIIATASVAGLRSNAGSTAYSASKAAVISIIQTSAFQLAGKNIRTNAICPGVIETGMTAPMYEAARARGTDHKIGQLAPLRRGGTADEVARVALFLASEEASYINGQAWAVDGGLSAGHPVIPGKIA